MDAGADLEHRAWWTERLAEYRRSGDLEWMAVALRGLVVAHLDHGAEEPARRALDELSALRQSTDRPWVDVSDFLARARFEKHRGHMERAVWLLMQAVHRARRSGNPQLLAPTLDTFAEFCAEGGRDDDAREARKEAVELHVAAKALSSAAESLLALAALTPEDEQLPLLQRAVDLADASREAHVRVWTQQALGQWRTAAGQYLPARRAFERALAACREGWPRDLGDVLVDLAWLESRHHHDAESLRFSEEALAVAKSPLERAAALRARVEGLGQEHRHREALRDVREAAFCYRVAGLLEEEKECNRRAWNECFLVVGHLLPRWVFESADRASLVAVERSVRLGRAFAFLAVAPATFTMTWTVLFGWVARHAAGVPQQLALLTAFLPSIVLVAASLLMTRDLLRTRQRLRRAQACAVDPPEPRE